MLIKITFAQSKKGEWRWMGFASQIKEQMLNTPPEPGRAGRGGPSAATVRRQTSVAMGSSQRA